MDEVAEAAKYLYGGEAAQPGFSGSASDGDAEESIVSILNYKPDIDATHELAAFLLGGNAIAPSGMDQTAELTAFLLGGDAAPIRLADVASDSVEGMISYLYSGEASNAVDEVAEAAKYLYGGDAAPIRLADVASDSVEGMISYLYGGEASNAMDDVAEAAKYLYGGDAEEESVQDDDTSLLAKFLLGSASASGASASGGREQLADSTADVDHDQPSNSVDSVARYLYSGDRGNVEANDDVRSVALFLYGGAVQTASAQTAEDATAEDPVAETAKYLYGSALDEKQANANPFENEDGTCTSEDCISFALLQVQEDTGVSDADLDAGLAWGDDMIRYCRWQARQQRQPSSALPKVGAPPPLPRQHTKPPAASVCRNVMASAKMLVQTASL